MPRTCPRAPEPERSQTIATLRAYGLTKPPRYSPEWHRDMAHSSITGWVESSLTRRELIAGLPEAVRARRVEEAAVFSIDLDAVDRQPVQLPYVTHDTDFDLPGWVDMCYAESVIAGGYHLVGVVWPLRTLGPLLDLRQVADRLGLSYATVRRYRSQDATFPDPDALLGQSPGWRAETIDTWQASRPGRGAGGGRPSRKGDDAKSAPSEGVR